MVATSKLACIHCQCYFVSLSVQWKGDQLEAPEDHVQEEQRRDRALYWYRSSSMSTFNLHPSPRCGWT